MPLRAALVTVVSALVVAVAPAVSHADPQGAGGASTAQHAAARHATAQHAPAPVKRVTRRYGGGPVALEPGQRLVLRFHGRRGDRVRLGPVYRDHHTGEPYYGYTSGGTVALRGPDGRRVRTDRTGFFRLPTSGWFRLTHRGSRGRVQLFKQVRLSHAAGEVTRVPHRRGYQYAVRLTVGPGLRVVSFGTWLDGAVAGGRVHIPGGQALVVSPGLPLVGSGVTRPGDPLEVGQRVLAVVAPAASGRVVTTRPTAVDAAIDGAGVVLPSGSAGAVLATLDAADVARSPQDLVSGRIVGGPTSPFDWTVLVVTPAGDVVRPAPYTSNGAPPLFRLDQQPGTYRVVAFPSRPRAGGGSLELHTVVDGGPVVVNGPVVTVPARPDGRFTLLTISEPTPDLGVDVSVEGTTVPAPWRVYAGQLDDPYCPPRGPLGCADGWGVSLTDPADSFEPIWYGGHVLTMPLEGQATGEFSVRLTSVTR